MCEELFGFLPIQLVRLCAMINHMVADSRLFKQ